MPGSPRLNPYVGPRSFEENEVLYGRDRELGRLTDRLIAERIVLLHSPSGAGKTSLVQAGLLPVMRAEGFHLHPVIRLNRQPGPGMLPNPGLEPNRYLLSVLLSLEEEIAVDQRYDLARLAQMTLDDYLRCRAEEAQRDSPELLVFDQFEEVITVNPANREEKNIFFIQLGIALRNRSLWALFAMREDFVGTLEPYVRLVPTFFTNTFYLDLLGDAAAREAVQKPVEKEGMTFTEEAARKLVDDLRRIQVQRPDGSLESVPGPYVEPVQLQVVCYRLWETHERTHPEDIVIDLDDISDVGNVDQSLGEYYAQSVNSAAAEGRATGREIREWFENQLITPEGIRSQVLRGAEHSGGLANAMVQRLVDSHVIRAENRGGKTWYELAHDRLIDPVRHDNAAWFARNLNVFQRQAVIWEQRGRSEGLLLRGDELALAEDDAGKMTLTAVENDFLAACRQAHERREREKRRTRVITILAIAATASLIIAIVLGFLASSAAREAQSAADANESLAKTLVVESTASSENARRAEANLTTAVAEKNRADLQAQLVLIRQLAIQAQSVASVDETNLELGMLLFREATNLQNRLGLGDLRELKSSFLNMMLSAPRPVQNLSGHTGPVLKVAISPDSRWIASASADSTIRVWEIASGKPLLTLAGHAGSVNAVAFVPGGQFTTLISAGEDGTIREWIWTAEWEKPEGKILMRLSKPVYALAVDPTGVLLAESGEDQTIRVYNLVTRWVEFVFRGHTAPVYALAFNGSALVSIDGRNDLRTWDLESGRPLNQSNANAGDTVYKYRQGLAFSPDGNLLVTGYGYDVVNVYGSYSDKLIQHTSAILDVAYSPDGLRIASASEDWRIGFFVPGRDPIYLKGHKGPVNTVAFSSDNHWLVSGGDDGNVLVWNALAPYIVRSLAGPIVQGRRWNVEGLAFSPDSKVLAASNWDNSIRFWDVDNGTILNEFYPGQGTLGVISMSPDGKMVAFGAESGPHRVWSLDGTPVLSLDMPASDFIYGTAFSPDGKWLVTDKDRGKSVCLWGLENQGNLCQPVPGDRIATRYAFHPDGKYFVSASGSDILLWDMTSLPPKARLLGSNAGYVFSLAFSPDGKWLASGDSLYTIQLWDMEQENPTPILLDNSGRFARSVVFSADGKMLFSANEDWKMRWWDVETAESLIAPVQVSFNRLDSAAFSPDGRYLATGDFDGVINLWPGNDAMWQATACQLANRNLTRAEYARYINSNNPFAYDTIYAKNPTCPNFPVEK